METKICTDMEQSERLIKLGLDTNTADMYYWENNGQWFVSPLAEGGFNVGSNNDKLCWSLSALLGLMPVRQQYTKTGRDIHVKFLRLVEMVVYIQILLMPLLGQLYG